MCNLYNIYYEYKFLLLRKVLQHVLSAESLYPLSMFYEIVLVLSHLDFFFSVNSLKRFLSELSQIEFWSFEGARLY